MLFPQDISQTTYLVVHLEELQAIEELLGNFRTSSYQDEEKQSGGEIRNKYPAGQ